MPVLVVGAGSVGSALATLLAGRGETVTLVSRSGRGPSAPGVRCVPADAADADALAVHARGAAAVVNCVNPGPYQQWEERWPPVAASLLAVAERSGAVLVTLSNLYGYGPVDGPLHRDLPLAATGHKGRLRARLWQEALAAHEAGRVRVTEVRASDFIGPTVPRAGGLLRRYADAALRGRTVWSFGDPDAPHAFSYVPDVARTLAVVAGDARAWGRAWHVPGPPERSVRQTLTDLVAAAQPAPGTASSPRPAPRVRRVPRPLLTAGGAVVPVLRELGEVLWQAERPFLLDATATTATFGLRPTAWEEVVAATARGWAGAATAPGGQGGSTGEADDPRLP
ncbi:MAG: NAD-dependent epimerase/dehydratase family protein [Micrococcales bacterium]|nr:NAD-dependent epimerase/dehydratase family protein [Micrococcales bacterium]